MAAADAADQFQHRYVSVLRGSGDSLASEVAPVAHGVTKKPTINGLVAHFAQHRLRYVESLDHLKHFLGTSNRSEQALEQSGQWSRVTANVLFRFLASNSPIALPNDWKRCLTKLAMLLLELSSVLGGSFGYTWTIVMKSSAESENGGCGTLVAEEHSD